MPLKIPFPVPMNPFQILSPTSAIPLPRFFPSPTLKNVMAAPVPNTFLVVFVIAVGSGGTVVVGWMGDGDGALGLVWSIIVFWFSVSFWFRGLCVVG